MAFISYWLLPLTSACVWLAMLLALFIVWIVQGSPHYPSMTPTQRIAYISDIGAQGLKPLFIAGCTLTTIFLDLSFLAERWLRHRGRLAKNTTRTQKVLVAMSIIFAIIGTIGLILLSVFDTLRYPRLHRVFLLLFMLGYIVSAVFTCAEYQRLGKDYRQHRVLRLSFWIKLVFILVEFGLVIGYGVCLYQDQPQPGAVIEWIIALIFTFYVLSFIVDLYPASRTKKHRDGLQPANLEMGTAASTNGTTTPATYYSNGQVANGTSPNAPVVPPHHMAPAAVGKERPVVANF
ncbi:MAG: hypothetical protein M1833_003255 [Piccolia ochrophora]|nr:MAG: hypothetical protein M1833_003255 [Piccolia ochrophora]